MNSHGTTKNRFCKSKKYSQIACLIVIILAFPARLFSQTDQYIDSLMQIVDFGHGKQRLEALDKLVTIKRHEKDGLKYTQLFEKEALMNGDDEVLGRAYMGKAKYYYFGDKRTDSAHYYLNKITPLKIDAELEKEMLFFLISLYVAEGKNDLVMFYTKKILANENYTKDKKIEIEAYIRLAGIYAIQENHNESIRTLEKGLALIENNKEHLPSYNRRLYKTKIYLQLILQYQRDQQPNQSIAAKDSVLSLIHQIETLDKKSVHILFKQAALISVSRTYIDKNEPDSARLMLDSAKATFDAETLLLVFYEYYGTEANYYRCIKNYNKALEYIRLALTDEAKAALFQTDIIDHQVMQSEILSKLGRNAEAYNLLNETYYQQDSLTKVQFASQINQIHTIYEVDKVKSEIALKSAKLYQTKGIAYAAIGTTLLCLLILILLRRNQTLKERKNKKIYEQYLLIKSYLDDIHAKRTDAAKQRQDNNGEPCDALADIAKQYLIETGSFKQDITRDDLALALGTNRQYLTESIREVTGKTYRDFLNSIRLEYAHNLLLTDVEASVEQVYNASGFSSRSTFNRLFRMQFEMSPNEMRDVARQREQEIHSQPH